MNMLLAALIAAYLLSGFVATQVSLPAIEQVAIRVVIAGFMAAPFLSPRRLSEMPTSSLLLCFITAASGYLVAAWSFSHAIVLGGYGAAVFITSLPWLGFLDLTVKGRRASLRAVYPLLLSVLGAVVFFIPELTKESFDIDRGSVILWSLLAALSGAFAQYARRLHHYRVPSNAIADGVLVSALLQSSLLLPQVRNLPSLSDISWLVIGGGCYLFSNRLSNRVFAEVDPTKAAVWMSTEPVIALLLGLFFLGELPNYFQFIGGALLCAASLSTAPTCTAMPPTGSLRHHIDVPRVNGLRTGQST
jgi:drug/metabolite transporter (DMT)-like permease